MFRRIVRVPIRVLRRFAASRLFASRLASAGALVAGALVAGLGIAALVDGDSGSGPQAPDAELALVEEFATVVTTFEAGRIDADIDRILALGTDGFDADFRESMGDTFVADLRASGASSSGEILAGPTVQRVGDSTSVYFVVVNQRIVAPSTSAPSTNSSSEEGTTTSTVPGGDAAPVPPQADESSQPSSRVARVGLVVQVDREAELVSSVQVL